MISAGNSSPSAFFKEGLLCLTRNSEFSYVEALSAVLAALRYLLVLLGPAWHIESNASLEF